MDKYLSKIIDKRQLASVMNNTKWRELCSSFEAMGDLSPSVRYKLISENGTQKFHQVWWHEILNEASAIEWMDFDPVLRRFQGKLVSEAKTDLKGSILEVFDRHNIPYSVEGAYLRVWGYISAENSPKFV